MRKINIMMLISAVVVTSICFGQTSPLNKTQLAQKTDSAIKVIMERIPVVPGLSISLVDENGALLTKGYGWADKEANIKANENTLFYIASNTKAFTALAAAMLDQEKKILLDSPFKKYFPAIQFKNNIRNDITNRQLLTHTSGIQNNPMVFRMAFSGDVENQAMLRLLGDASKTVTEPGVFAYDNLGYNIYGLALQEHLHKKWQDVLQEKIFTPLGMNRTTAYISLAEKNKWQIAAPYDGLAPKGLTKLYITKKDNTMQSAGGLVTTASDISRWLQVQINQGKLNNKQVFPAELIKATQTGFVAYEKGPGPTPTGKYALGWNISKYETEDFIFHFGGYPGYKSHISFMPGKKIGLAIFVNEGGIGGGLADVVATYIYDLVRGATDADQSFAKKVEQLESMSQKEAESIQKSFVSRASRTSQLTLPLNAYTGTYRNEWYGDVVVTVDNNSLAVRFGNLYAVSTPFTEKETIRVELIPAQGRVVSFQSGDEGKINSLVFDKEEYKKMK